MIPAAVFAILAGGCAAVVRYLVSQAIAGRGVLPWAVLVVNVVGTAIGGAAVGLATTGVIPGDLRLVLLSGVAGGLTTFSTWSVESMELFEEGKWRTAVASVAINLVAGIVVAAAAYLLVGGR